MPLSLSPALWGIVLQDITPPFVDERLAAARSGVIAGRPAEALALAGAAVAGGASASSAFWLSGLGWLVLGSASEAYSHFEVAYVQATHAGDLSSGARLMACLCVAARMLGQFGKSRRLGDLALQLAPRDPTLAEAIRYQAAVTEACRNPKLRSGPDAIRIEEGAQEAGRRKSISEREADIGVLWAAACLARDDLDTAIVAALRAHERARAAGFRLQAAAAATVVARNHVALGDAEGALEWFAEAQATYASIGALRGLAYVAENAAEVFAMNARYGAATQLLMSVVAARSALEAHYPGTMRTPPRGLTDVLLGRNPMFAPSDRWNELTGELGRPLSAIVE